MRGHAFRFRRATAADLPAINELIQASSTYHGEYRAMVATYVVGPAQVMHDHMHLAEDASGVAGFYSLKLDPEPELDLMFVADHAQGKGIGRALIAHMMETARRLGVAEIKIVSHPPSVGFYKRVGAVEVGVKPPAGRITWPRPVLALACGETAALDDSTP